MAKLLSTVKSALIGSGRQEKRRRQEEPVGNSQIVQGLKRQIQDLRGSSRAVFLTGAFGSGRRIWADYLCTAAGGMEIFDGQKKLSALMPLGSNLYFEEIIDLSLAQQSLLYDAILASNQGAPFRIIVSTRLSYDALKQSVQVDSRLAEMWVDAIAIPSLDEHIEDIPELLEYYVNWYNDHEQLPYRHFDVAAQNLLRNHHWSGDISQLKQFIKSILNNSAAEKIEMREIEQALQHSTATVETNAGNKMQIAIDMDLDLREAREVFEREYLSRHLALSGNNMTELARRVGQERTHLYRKLKSLGLQAKKQ